jgi:hypothetical protein
MSFLSEKMFMLSFVWGFCSRLLVYGHVSID